MSNTPPKRNSLTRLWKVALLAIVVVGLVSWRCPLFHLIPLEQAQQEHAAGVFDPEKVAGAWWNSTLMPATENAVELKDLFAALAEDPAAAREQFGRTFGLGGATLFFVRGDGTVTALEDESVVVTLEGLDAKVTLTTGLLFGNTVRDASGLLDVSAYPNSQDFNDLSTQLNTIVETTVAPALMEAAAVGKAIRFAGCFELEEDGPWDVLTLIPINIEWP